MESSTGLIPSYEQLEVARRATIDDGLATTIRGIIGEHRDELAEPYNGSNEEAVVARRKVLAEIDTILQQHHGSWVRGWQFSSKPSWCCPTHSLVEKGYTQEGAQVSA